MSWSLHVTQEGGFLRCFPNFGHSKASRQHPLAPKEPEGRCVSTDSPCPTSPWQAQSSSRTRQLCVLSSFFRTVHCCPELLVDHDSVLLIQVPGA